MRAVEAVVTERVRDHVFLRLRQAGKRGAGRRRCCAAPDHVLVGVVSDQALREGAHLLEAGLGTEVEVHGGSLLGCQFSSFCIRLACGLQSRLCCREGCCFDVRNRLDHHCLLRCRQILELHVQRRAQLAGHQQLLVVVEQIKGVVLDSNLRIRHVKGELDRRGLGAHTQIDRRRRCLRVARVKHLARFANGADVIFYAGIGVDGRCQPLGHVEQRIVRRRADIAGEHGVADGLAVERERNHVASGKAAAEREPVGLRRYKLHHLVNNGLLRTGQFGIGRAGGRQRHAAPLGGGNSHGEVQ